VVVGVRPLTTIPIDLPVTVVLVVVVPVVELRTEVTAAKEVRVHQVRDTTVPDQVIIGIQLVVGVPVRKVTVETGLVVLIPYHMVVMV
tara:strand:- start:570 stop:833 length:264 start_codon:yes stop_codon:yes gene_type:complete